MNPRIVFMGSPDFAVPALKGLHQNYTVVGVVTQPDRRAGRGRKLRAPVVKNIALEFGLPVIQPHKLSEPEAMETLREWDPDIIVVAAFGQILKTEVLNLPELGCLNVHASLLPRWRGAAPIQATILNGDTETGVTIMLMDPGLDTGPILSQTTIPIDATDTGDTLSDRLAALGADLLLDTLPGYINGEIRPNPQDNTLATKAPLLKKSDGELDFTQPIEYLERKVRALHSWPGAYTTWLDKRLILHQVSIAKIETMDNREIIPGKIYQYKRIPAIGADGGLLVLEELQPAGKKVMPGDIFLLGAQDWID